MTDETLASRNAGKVIVSHEDKAVIRDKVAEATCPYPGYGVIKGTADHQVVVATEEHQALYGICLEDRYGGKGTGTIFTAADPVKILTGGACTFLVLIQANIAAISMGQKIVCAAEAGKFKAHPDDLAVATGASTVLSTAPTATFTGYRNNCSYLIAEETLAKDTSDDNWIEARFANT